MSKMRRRLFRRNAAEAADINVFADGDGEGAQPI